MDESILVRLTLDAVQSTCESNGNWPSPAARTPAGLPRVILTILTYSYAVGIYASEEIAARICSDPNLRYLSAGARPTWHELRRFRRPSRAVIQQALSRLFESAWQFRLWPVAEIPATDPEWRDRLAGSDCAGAMREPLIARATDDRINQAVWWDSMALDE